MSMKCSCAHAVSNMHVQKERGFFLPSRNANSSTASIALSAGTTKQQQTNETQEEKPLKFVKWNTKKKLNMFEF